MAPAANLSAEALKVRIRTKYAAPEWATFTEVANATGTGAGVTRYADAFSFNLYPSRGFARHGFEIKVSRSDWLRELKNPAKADPIAQFCHQWWIVVSGPNIVQDGELPAGWGLMVPRGTGLGIVTTAKAREAVKPTEAFTAAILRRSIEQSPAQVDMRARQVEVQEMLTEAIETRVANMRDSYAREIDSARHHAARLETNIAAINRGLGHSLAIRGWESAERLEAIGALAAAGIRGEDVHTKIKHGLEEVQRDILALHASAQSILDSYET